MRDRLIWVIRQTRQHLHPIRQGKRIVRKLLTQWKWVTSKDYRKAIGRLRTSQAAYRQTEPLYSNKPILLIAETSIPQCLKYRVQQRQDCLAELDVPSTWIPWQNTEACLRALQTHSAVIFYRTPLFASVKELVRESKRLGLPIIWEVDDLIFDAAVLRATPTLQDLDRHTFRGLIKGADLYRRALKAADAGLASTTCLAGAMAEAGSFPVHVVHNSLDGHTLELAEQLLATRTSNNDGLSRIVYGSGSNTHNHDFKQASPALLELLKAYPNLRLRLIGELQLDREFDHFADQIERFQPRDYAGYLALLAECQINLAPLEHGLFNDCKSNIKWLEASALAIPSVCSPRSEFKKAIVHGENGFLCDGTRAWKDALRSLIEEAPLRQSMGAAARTTALKQYSQRAIANNELRPWLEGLLPQTRTKPKFRVLNLNVYYSPQSFGGATLVAEQLNNWLVSEGELEVGVLCLIPDGIGGGKSLHRYTVNGVQVFGVPAALSKNDKGGSSEASSEALLEQFAAVLDGFAPDIIHVHSIQGIGIDVLDQARQRNIPYMITLHDAWWLCPRQFMLTPEGHYCHQRTIDQQVCAACTGLPGLVERRALRMREALEGAHTLLAPSQFFVDLFRSNGYEHVHLNGNGIVQPGTSRKSIANVESKDKQPIRYGYLGGNVDIKGFGELQTVFRRLSKKPDLKLVLVDNTLNLGHPSYFAKDLFGLAHVQVVPAFTQGTIDEFYNEIDVLLFPTRCKESFGLAIREALARGVWVISSDAGGTVEAISDGLNGRIIPIEDDGTALEQAVLEAAEIVRTSRQEGGGRKGTPMKLFAEQAGELINLYKQILKL